MEVSNYNWDDPPSKFPDGIFIDPWIYFYVASKLYHSYIRSWCRYTSKVASCGFASKLVLPKSYSLQVQPEGAKYYLEPFELETRDILEFKGFLI